MKCPHCGKTIPKKLIASEAARRANAKRETFGAGTGRPPNPNRCKCGAMTAGRVILATTMHANDGEK